MNSLTMSIFIDFHKPRLINVIIWKKCYQLHIPQLFSLIFHSVLLEICSFFRNPLQLSIPTHPTSHLKKKSQAAPPLLTQSSNTPITEGFWENQSSRTKLCKSAPLWTQYVITLTAEPAMQGAKDKASSHCTNLPRSTTVLRVAWQARVLHDYV